MSESAKGAIRSMLKINKIEFQSFKVKEDTKALSKMAKEVSGIQSLVTSHHARIKWAVLVQSSPCPYKVGSPELRFGVWFVSKIIVILAKAGIQKLVSV